ncbi:MAG: ROK family transcriptional regulator [Rhodobacterales bacterium]|nr:ROK family transcriptional regulator [Rhodobacterales bacterium]
MDRIEMRSPSVGANQQGVRDHNERLILSMIQRQGALPGRDLARLAGLSPQTVSVILRELEQDGFIERGDPQRGRVGKPSVPMTLAADGVYSIGLKLGRRSADLVLADFHGTIRGQLQTTYRYPVPDHVFSFLKSGLATLTAGMGPDAVARIAGIGIAKPYQIWDWHEAIGAPEGELGAWREIDFLTEIAGFSDLPVYVENDATAACRAEHVFGRGREFRDFAYFFVGSFIGGGVVLNHSVFEGATGNAAAFGSLPTQRPDGKLGQLIDSASLFLLEAELIGAGLEPARLWAQPQDWSGFSDILDDWIDKAAAQIAQAALTVCAVIDFEAVLIDGGFPATVRDRLVDRVREIMPTLDSRGLTPVAIHGGLVGGDARALGAACGPVFSRYMLNTHTTL